MISTGVFGVALNMPTVPGVPSCSGVPPWAVQNSSYGTGTRPARFSLWPSANAPRPKPAEPTARAGLKEASALQQVANSTLAMPYQLLIGAGQRGLVIVPSGLMKETARRTPSFTGIEGSR